MVTSISDEKPKNHGVEFFKNHFRRFQRKIKIPNILDSLSSRNDSSREEQILKHAWYKKRDDQMKFYFTLVKPKIINRFMLQKISV